MTELTLKHLSLLSTADKSVTNAVLIGCGYDHAGFDVQFQNKTNSKHVVYDINNPAPGGQFVMSIIMEETLKSADGKEFTVNKMEIVNPDTQEKLVLYDFEYLLEEYAYILNSRQGKITNIPIRLGAYLG